jgi:hypothetical protein
VLYLQQRIQHTLCLFVYMLGKAGQYLSTHMITLVRCTGHIMMQEGTTQQSNAHGHNTGEVEHLHWFGGVPLDHSTGDRDQDLQA